MASTSVSSTTRSPPTTPWAITRTTATRDDPRSRRSASAARPERDGERHREQPDQRAEEPVAVLVEHAADHLRPREQEHVVAEGRRPVGHGQRGARVGHETAEHDQARTVAAAVTHGQPVRPAVTLGVPPRSVAASVPAPAARAPAPPALWGR